MKSKIVGWVLLIAGGSGIIISAVIGSDWPMYACMILASAGVALLIYTGCRKSRSRPQAH
jgi:hypothetical protein